MIRDLTKRYLRTGDVVVTKGGWQGVVLLNTASGDIIKWFKDGLGNIIQKYRSLSTVNDDLTYATSCKIVKVYRSPELGLLTSCDVVQDRFLLWEDSTREMTVSDIEKALGHKVKIVKG